MLRRSRQPLHQVLGAKLELLKSHQQKRGCAAASLFAAQLLVDPLVREHQSVESVGHDHSSSKALLSIGAPMLV